MKEIIKTTASPDENYNATEQLNSREESSLKPICAILTIL